MTLGFGVSQGLKLSGYAGGGCRVAPARESRNIHNHNDFEAENSMSDFYFIFARIYLIVIDFYFFLSYCISTFFKTPNRRNTSNFIVFSFYIDNKGSGF